MRKKTILLFCYIFFLSGMLQAQVTIGSHQAPNKGALLDLKENADGTSTRGLCLPRVKLEDVRSLKPALPTHVIGTPDEEHTGLVVYHVSGEAKPQCATIPDGLYVWNGIEWRGINVPDRNISLTSSTYSIDLPSGLDARGTNTTGGFKLSWLPAGTNVTYIADDISSEVTGRQQLLGGIVLSGMQENPLSGGNVFFSMKADPVYIPNGNTDIRPWKTRVSTLKFFIKDDECGNELVKEVIVNQTNYAINYGNLGTGTIIARMIDKNKTYLSEYLSANVPWRLKSISDPHQILTANNPTVSGNLVTSGGQYLKNGTAITTFNGLQFTLNDAYDGYKYEYADVVIEEDMSKSTIGKPLAIPLNLRIVTCRGEPNLSGLREVEPAETSDTSADWGTDVILHKAKPGVYEQFVSADFGEAGRWMTTNLAATDYDGVAHDAGRSLTGPQRNPNAVFDAAVWAYPSKSGEDGTNPTIYNQNKLMGYLYTWDAATAGKGEISGKGNADTGSTSTESPYWNFASELRFKEAIGPYTEVKPGTDPGKYPISSGLQKRRQGICPKGWHLPSEREWIVLQREIIKNTTRYSTIDKNIDSGNGDVLAQFPIDVSGTKPVAYRSPERVGLAMKDMCEPRNNLSKEPTEGGFSVLYTGGTNGDDFAYFGQHAYFWTSTAQSYPSAVAIQFTYLGLDASFVHTSAYPGRPAMKSIRCKRDD